LVALFYFWASSATYPPEKYTEVVSYGPSTATRDDDGVFTVVSYNIGYLSGLTNNLAVARDRQLYDTNLETARAALAGLNADFIGFQEIDLNSRRSFNVDQVAALAEKLGFAQGAIALNWDKRYVPFPYWPPTAHFGRIVSGQALLSRYPITANERVVLQKVASKPFFYNALYLDRLAQVTQVDVQGQPLILINVHLEAFDAPTRRQQTQVMLDLFNQYDAEYPVLMLGDFNSSPQSSDGTEPTINALLQADYLRAEFPSELFSSPAVLTFPSDQPEVKLDYVFYNPAKIEAVDARVVQEAAQASDHLPVMMRFRLR
jgi:endonuclease/exonuclease/phosphatase family metal-dependent hydrolase